MPSAKQNDSWTLIDAVRDTDPSEKFEVIHPPRRTVKPQDPPASNQIYSAQFLKNLRKITVKTGIRKRAVSVTPTLEQPDFEVLGCLLFFWFIVINLVITSIFTQLIRRDTTIQNQFNTTKVFETDESLNRIIPRLIAKYLDMDRVNSEREHDRETILGLLKEQSVEMKQLKASIHELKLYFDQVQYDIVKQVDDFKNEITAGENSLEDRSTAWVNFVNMVNVMMAEMQTRNFHLKWTDAIEKPM